MAIWRRAADRHRQGAKATVCLRSYGSHLSCIIAYKYGLPLT